MCMLLIHFLAASTCAPFSSSTLMASTWPFSAAMCSGVHPSAPHRVRTVMNVHAAHTFLGCIHLRALLQQHLDGFDMALLCGDVQRCPSICPTQSENSDECA